MCIMGGTDSVNSVGENVQKLTNELSDPSDQEIHDCYRQINRVLPLAHPKGDMYQVWS